MIFITKVILASIVAILIWHHATVNAESVQKTNQERAVTNHQSPTTETQQRNQKFLSVIETSERLNYSKDDLFCLTKNIYHEAGNQSRLGKYAIAQVTINRVKHSSFGGSVCDVVFEPHQFSWANNRKARWSIPKPNEVWKESKEIAYAALAQGMRVKGMENAMYFHANYVRPRWTHAILLTRIGAHVFYNRA